MSKPGKLFSIVAGVLVWIGGIGFVLWLVKRVLDGKGTDLYRSHWGISYSAIGLLITLGVVIFLGLVAGYLHQRRENEEKDFLEKYGKNKDE